MSLFNSSAFITACLLARGARASVNPLTGPPPNIPRAAASIISFVTSAEFNLSNVSAA